MFRSIKIFFVITIGNLPTPNFDFILLRNIMKKNVIKNNEQEFIHLEKFNCYTISKNNPNKFCNNNISIKLSFLSCFLNFKTILSTLHNKMTTPIFFGFRKKKKNK